MAQSSPPDTRDTAEVGGNERRQHPRHACRCLVVCRAGTASCDAVLVDASDGGFGLDGLTLTAGVDAVITIELDQIGTFRCRVAWRRGTRAGVEFLDEESPGEADMQDMARGLTQA